MSLLCPPLFYQTLSQFAFLRKKAAIIRVLGKKNIVRLCDKISSAHPQSSTERQWCMGQGGAQKIPCSAAPRPIT